MEKLSELEGAALGLIWDEGPMTAYAVRSHFQKSRSSHFSGSAGAIYPLVKRMLTAGLLVASARHQGRRASTVNKITASGRQALRTWLTPVEDWMVAVEFDPIRTRVHFLATLSPKKRAQFLRDAEEKLEAEILATEELVSGLAADDNPWSTWSARGALAVLSARREWIMAMRREMGGA